MNKGWIRESGEVPIAYRSMLIYFYYRNGLKFLVQNSGTFVQNFISHLQMLAIYAPFLLKI